MNATGGVHDVGHLTNGEFEGHVRELWEHLVFVEPPDWSIILQGGSDFVSKKKKIYNQCLSNVKTDFVMKFNFELSSADD